MLPEYIRLAFTAVLAGRLSIAEFEQWVYATPELETALASDDYLELISFNYRQCDAPRLLEPLLGRYVSWGEVQREELLGHLRAIQARPNPDAVVNALQATYDWYCRGCYFLNEVAMSAGLEVSCYRPAEITWAGLTDAQKWAYLQPFYPSSGQGAERIIGWLETGHIRFEAELSSDWYFHYVDSRAGNQTSRTPDQRSADPWPTRPRWWNFWRKHR